MGNLYSVLKEKLNKIEVNGKTLYIAEGDTLLDDAQLKIYADVREKENAARAAAKDADAKGFGSSKLEVSHGLVAMTKDGQVIRWRPGTVLSYRVVQSSFPSPQHYQLVVDNLKAATGAWEATCGIDFQHKAELDNPAGKKGLKLVWFATGVDDGLMPTTKGTVEMLKKHGFSPQMKESPGGHTWINWREYLNEFTPLLF